MGFGTEGWTTEFVDGMDQLDDALRSMTAMLNRFNKAEVYIGVDGEGEPIGHLTEDDVAKVIGRMSEKVRTAPKAKVTLEHSGGFDFIRISATGYETPYSFGSWFYTRKCNPTQPHGSSGPVVNEWTETLTCGMKRHRSLVSDFCSFYIQH